LHRRDIETKAAQIALYKQQYYQGKSTIPDDVYDELESELRRLDPTHPVLSKVGYDVQPVSGKVTHFPPMLSLEKSYDPQDIEKFIDQMGTVCCTDKMDGMALALEYGRGGQLIRASTRGNGVLGENVTAHVLLVPGIPKRLELDCLIAAQSRGNLVAEVRGEVYFPFAAFERHSDRFESFRNAVPGTFGRKEPQEAADILAGFEFCAYDVLFRMSAEDGLPSSAGAEDVIADSAKTASLLGLSVSSHLEKLRQLEKLGFWAGVGDQRTFAITLADLSARGLSVDAFLRAQMGAKRPYAIDGLVLRCDDDARYASLGTTSHHPRGSLAFKQAGETSVTEILTIHMGLGRSGKVSFRAELKPVFLSGATLAFATLHNAEFIESGGYAPGARVFIKRSGEVIPYIFGLETPAASPYVLPTVCLCGSVLTRQGPDLYCLDNPTCPYRDSESLLYFVRSLEIFGVSEKLLERFREADLVTSPSDLFQITKEDLLTLDGFGPKLAQNVIDSIQSKRTLPLAMFLTSLGLKRGGKVKCLEVAKHFGTLERIRALTAQELVQLDGWAEKSAEDFLVSLEAKRPLIDELLKWVQVVDEPKRNEAATSDAANSPLSGKRVCITGALSEQRKVYEDLLLAAGASLSSAVSSQTSYLVCNEASGSSKYKKAQELGVSIIDENQLRSLLGLS
jgi:DNA ligase (NAD+)